MGKDALTNNAHDATDENARADKECGLTRAFARGWLSRKLAGAFADTFKRFAGNQAGIAVERGRLRLRRDAFAVIACAVVLFSPVGSGSGLFGSTLEGWFIE